MSDIFERGVWLYTSLALYPTIVFFAAMAAVRYHRRLCDEFHHGGWTDPVNLLQAGVVITWGVAALTNIVPWGLHYWYVHLELPGAAAASEQLALALRPVSRGALLIAAILHVAGASTMPRGLMLDFSVGGLVAIGFLIAALL